MKITLKITQEHIDKGQLTCTHCPIALSLKDMGYNFPWIEEWGIYIYPDTKYTFADYRNVELPDEVIDWIRDFDMSLPVTPVEFELELEERMK
jgi:hypothetical protein